MISAQADTLMQEQLIEKYMLLPNQVWDDIISQASKVCNDIPSIFRIKSTLYFYKRKYAFFFSLERGCFEGPRSSETTRQHLENKR